MSKQHLVDELERLQEHEEYCAKLSNLFADGNQELGIDPNGYMHRTIINRLENASDVIARRILVVGELLEAIDNERMDNFRNRRLT